MKVRITFDCPKNWRRVVNFRVGRDGLADRAQMIQEIKSMVDADFQSILSDLDNDETESEE